MNETAKSVLLLMLILALIMSVAILFYHAGFLAGQNL